jgi:ADP-heptose:LPS heptosyltransferase
MTPLKILVLRFSSIGDIVLTTPVVRALKTQLAGVEVHYCTKKQFASLVAHNPYIDRCLYLEKDLGELITFLKREKYDYVVDLHNNLRTRIIKLRLGVKAFTFNKLNREKWLLVNFKINRMPDVHIVDRYLETVKALGVRDDGRGLDYFIPSQDVVDKDALPAPYRNGYATFAIGGQHYTKKLPLPRMIELAGLIGQPLMLLGGPEDAANGDAIVEAFEGQPGKHVFNACGKYTLNQSASLVQGADVVFSHDTGLMHIAAAFGKKIYSIWGNTVPALGMYPYRTEHVVWEKAHLYCRPCSKLGYKKCPQGHFKCMNEIHFQL